MTIEEEVTNMFSSAGEAIHYMKLVPWEINALLNQWENSDLFPY